LLCLSVDFRGIDIYYIFVNERRNKACLCKLFLLHQYLMRLPGDRSAL